MTLPGHGDRAADDARRGRGRIAFFPRRRRALELHDVLQREPVECRAIALALQEIEEREPCEHRKLGVVVVLDAFLELLAGIGRLTVGEAKRRILEHRAQSGIGLRDLERGLRRRPLREARAGDGDVTAGRFEMPAALGPCLRRELARGRGDEAGPPPLAGSGFFFAGGFEKNAICGFGSWIDCEAQFYRP